MSSIEELAKECLNCKNPMCKKGCPVLTSIPEFIQAVKNENMEEAYKILQSNNIMSEICSKICPVEEQCVGHCVKGIRGKSVRINKLEELVNIWGRNNNIKIKLKKELENKEKVAIIGGGPAGIACAVELNKKGYDVTIFEKEEKIGGILEYQIPDFRLSKTYVKEIEEKVIKLGIKVKTNMEFGKILNFKKLEDENYKAVFLGIGAYVPNIFKLTDKNPQGIYTADAILRKYYNKEKIDNLGKVIIIGGGNVAMDAARTLKKVRNEKVIVAYRRTEELMPAIKEEQEEAQKEGVEFLYNTRVIKVILNNENKITKLECVKTKIENSKVIDIPKSKFEIDADSVVFAIGLGIDNAFFNKLGINTENGLVKVDKYGMTNIKRNICRRRLNRSKTNCLQSNSKW